MQQRGGRHWPFWTAAALCLCLCVLRVVDLWRYTDPLTSFPTLGTALARCVLLAAAVAVFRLLAQGNAARPQALCAPCRGLAACLALDGAAWIACALCSLAVPLTAALALLAAFALLALAFQAWRPAARSAVPALAVLPALFWLASRRALWDPAAVSRLSSTLRVLSALAALVFAVALIRLLYLPAQPGARIAFTAGMACFLLGACTELPQAVYEQLQGTAQPGALPAALALAALGLCGLACAWYTAGGAGQDQNGSGRAQ